jgi:spore germination cell wall hydrolase CwlJ-like protein
MCCEGGEHELMAIASFNITPGETSEAAKSRRKIAESLLEQGMQSGPVRHWAVGLERIAKAMLGGYELGQIERAEKAKEAAAVDLVRQHPALQGGATSAVSPGIQRIASALAAPSTSGKVYSNDEPSPLDPPSGDDRDMLARTVLAEAGNQGPVGMQAVANVSRNRAVSGQFGGDTLPGVIQKPNQFEPWNTAQGRARMAAIDPNSPQYQQATQAIDRAYTGDDPTRGATHFYAPKAQAAMGRPAPAWDNGRGVDIGDHRFFGGAGGPPVMAGASPSDVSAQQRQQQQPAAAPGTSGGMQPAMRDYINRLIANPSTRGYGVQLLQEHTKRQDAEFGVIGKDPATGEDQRGWINKQDRTITPANIPGNQQPAGNSVIDPAPPGVDQKIWRETQSKRRAELAAPASWEDHSKLRKEVQDLPSYKNLAQAAPVYKSMMETAGRTDSRGSDVNLIYGMAKIMDPGSVVRESEMTVAQAIATLPQQLQATVKSQLTGTGRLEEGVRQQIMQEAHSRISAYKAMFDQDTGFYRGIAKRNRMTEDDVLPNFGEFSPWSPAGAAGAAAQLPPAGPQLDWRGEPAGGWMELPGGIKIREKK